MASAPSRCSRCVRWLVSRPLARARSMHICCARLGAICYSTLSTPALFTRGLGGLNGGLNGGLIALGLNGDPNAHGAQRLPKRPSAVETRCPNGPNARELNAHLLGPVGVCWCLLWGVFVLGPPLLGGPSAPVPVNTIGFLSLFSRCSGRWWRLWVSSGRDPR